MSCSMASWRSKASASGAWAETRAMTRRACRRDSGPRTPWTLIAPVPPASCSSWCSLTVGSCAQEQSAKKRAASGRMRMLGEGFRANGACSEALSHVHQESCPRGVHPRGAPATVVVSERESHRRRVESRAIGVRHVEVLVLQPGAERSPVRLDAGAPSKARAAAIESKQRAVGSLQIAAQGPPRSAGLSVDIHRPERQQSYAEDVEGTGSRVRIGVAAEKHVALVTEIDVVGFHGEGRGEAESHDCLPGIVVDLEPVAGVAEYVVHLCPDVTGADIEAGIGRGGGVAGVPAARPVTLVLALGVSGADAGAERADAQDHSEAAHWLLHFRISCRVHRDRLARHVARSVPEAASTATLQTGLRRVSPATPSASADRR